MTHFTIFNAKAFLDILRIHCLHMEFSRTMADLTSCIFQVWCLLDAHKPAWLSVPGRVACITTPDFFSSQSFFHPLDTLIGLALSCILHEIVIFLVMTLLTDIRSDIERATFLDFGLNMPGVYSVKYGKNKEAKNEGKYA